MLMYRASLAMNFVLFRLLGAFCVTALFAVTPVMASNSCSKDPECDDVSAWAVFTRITLKQLALGYDEAIEWRGSFDHEALDISIDIATYGTKKPVAGTVGLVGGQVMLTKGLKLEPGGAIDDLDAPVLYMRLVMTLLKRVFPKGPGQIMGPTDVDHTDQVGIKFATPSASGYIPAPWHVKGKVGKLPDGTLPFELALSMPLQQQGKQRGSGYSYNMQGELAVLGQPVFQDTDSLEGWTIYNVGPQVIEQGNSTIYDYGAKLQKNTRYRTIGDIRAFIAAKNHPGVKDVTKDFTGLWKEKCDQSFGLHIKHYGDEGKYSIVFCGPGGCGDPSESHPTFITGDKGYEVVSEDELIKINNFGKRHTYRRCTKDANPPIAVE
jgi:hypothetical protein